MQRSEVRPGTSLGLDLRPPVRLELWAITVAVSIAFTTVLPPIAPMLVLASLVVFAGAVIFKDLVPQEWRLMALLAPLFVGGGVIVALLHASTPDPLRELAALEPGEVVIVGEVSSAPVQTGFGSRADLRVEHLWHDEKEVLRGGGVEVFAPGLDGVGVGDRVRVDGEISLPVIGEDGFDYGRYLSTKRISAVVDATGVWPVDDERGWIGQVHRRTDVALGYGLRPEEASIVRGMVLGDRSLIPEEVDEAFQRSGITHILAISGQHVAILTALIYFVLRAFVVPLVPRTSITLCLIWLYILIAGAPPSAIRAGVVATLVLSAGLLGRQLSPVHFMTAMLALVLAYNPMLVYSAGFQLSVAAVFGILLLRKPIKKLLEASVFRPFGKPPDLVSNLLAISLAAQIATAPIIAASFEEVSVVGVATNLIAVPLSGPILTLGLLASMVGQVLPLLAFPLNAMNGFLVTILEALAGFASSLPFAVVATPGVSLLMIGVFYLGCVPAALCQTFLPEERWTFWASIMTLWVVLWLVLASLGSV
ncbi:MAG: ComEC/Rec2 family competence protein [Rubrobacteraceae bacterium]